MKKVLLFLFLTIAVLGLASCSVQEPTDTGSDIITNAEVSDTKDETFEDFKSHLYGDWVCTNGESEPIDKDTINGTPYTVKDIKKDSYGNLTYAVTVNGSEVIYTVYRYKVGFAEYSYMEAVFTAKDIVFKFSK